VSIIVAYLIYPPSAENKRKNVGAGGEGNLMKGGEKKGPPGKKHPSGGGGGGMLCMKKGRGRQNRKTIFTKLC